MPAPSLPSTFTRKRRAPGVGESVLRPDAPAKVQGQFAFSSDLFMDGMVWGKTLRSPFPHARIKHLDTSLALLVPGVHAVITNADLWGSRTYGLEHHDQPVFANEVALFHGEPIAAVAADHPEIAARAVAAIDVEYDVLEALSDPERSLDPDTPPIHPDGNVFRHIRLRHGDESAVGDVVVEGSYEVGMQDQAFLGPESGLAVPSEDGGVELFVATQWLHVDRNQIAACLNLPRDKVRLTLAGTGGAFGGREDLSMQIHACLLALVTRKPVKMVYSREESFFGHVHRHPARMWYRHQADRDGKLVKVECRMVFDGGAYASSSTAVISNAASFAAGPYLVPNAAIDGYAVRTNNPPCGAMRGFGAVQTSFAAEAQMDKLADALEMDPVELRLRNALKTHDQLLTGQVIIGSAPVAECIRACRDLPMPEPFSADAPMMTLPGGAGRSALHHNVKRGVGFAVGFKNLAYSEGFDDFSTARVRLELGPDDEPLATVHTAAAEVGQGFVTIAKQIARAELGVAEVIVQTADTQVGSAGSTNASRQTTLSGGAVQMACSAVREVLLERAALELHLAPADLVLEERELVTKDRTRSVSLPDALRAGAVEATREFHHPPTDPLDETGQGNAHWSLAFAAHRAVVDVDPDLGLVRVVQVATAQDVGKALNPLAVTGQIEGGIAQGVGLAVMEEIIVEGSRIRNPSFTDYLLPTPLDMPVVEQTWIEQPERGSPYGAKGVGEPPTISSTGAVLAAIRQATGLPLNRIPVRPDDIALVAEPTGSVG
jgi:xanthine dehydrogenase D subunit